MKMAFSEARIPVLFNPAHIIYERNDFIHAGVIPAAGVYRLSGCAGAALDGNAGRRPAKVPAGAGGQRPAPLRAGSAPQDAVHHPLEYGRAH